ncbi:MAG: TonB-dependent receptor [Bacteroidales bacterium]|nr:TonB-dependent receptor [Bacteroidales bacterium]
MRQILKQIPAVLLLLLWAATAGAQVRRNVLSGYVLDAASGEPLVQAVVYLEDRKTAAVADATGFYSLTIPAGKHTVTCSYFGYKDAVLELELNRALKHDFAMEPDREELEAATVQSRSKRSELVLPQMGMERVDATLVKKLPTLMGEADIIRVIQMMPGVQTPSEGATGFSVRGGGVDQNLVMIDGAPVYNTGHFLGFLSMFNGDAIRGADLYKGDFPALYGGRVASVLDISTKDGNKNTFGGNASIGLITSKLFVEGPIVPGKLSFMLAGRRTYVDLFFPLLGDNIPDKTKMFFYDLNGKLSWTAGEKDRVYLSAFSGRDIFGFNMADFDLGDVEFGNANHTQSLRWNHVYSPKLTSDVTLYHSLFNNSIGANMQAAAFDYLQGIREMGLKAGWTWYPNSSNTVRAGIQLARYTIMPGDLDPRAEATVVNEIHHPKMYAFQPVVYLQNEQKIDRLTVRYGLRLSSFRTLGPTEQRYFDPDTHVLTETRQFRQGETISSWTVLEPRLSASWSLHPDFSLKGAWSRTNQFLQQARISISGSPVDTWFTASPNVGPQVCDQFSFGANALFFDQGLELSLEGFYKHSRGAMDFIDNPGLVLDNPDREGLLRFGTSQAYGTELMLKYDFARWSGWLAYTWSRARYDIPGINGGKPYPSPLNHEHAINFVLTYDFSKQLSASAEWVFYSGAPTTYPVGRYQYRGRWVPVYASRNEDRLPDYHRGDLSLTWRTKGRVQQKRWSGEWNLSVYNVYARHNAWTIAFSYDDENARFQSYKVYLFTAIPSLSYNIQF